MEVTAAQIVKVEISIEEQKRIAIQTLRSAAMWFSDQHVQDGKLIQRETFHTTHSWTEDSIVRDATPLDLATDLLIKHILKLK